MIVYKHVVEKKPTNIVALETNHSQPAVDQYIKDYNRMKTLLLENNSLEFIHLVTKIAKSVIKHYQTIFEMVKES
jgi:predicted transcriptional regulator